MSDDLHDLLVLAVGDLPEDAPEETVLRRAAAMRRRRRVSWTTLSLLLVALSGAAVALQLSDGSVEFADATTGADEVWATDPPPGPSAPPMSFDDPFAGLPPRDVPQSVLALAFNDDWGVLDGGVVGVPGATFDLVVPSEALEGAAEATLDVRLDRIDEDGAVLETIVHQQITTSGPAQERTTFTLPDGDQSLYAVEISTASGVAWHDYVYAVNPVSAAVILVQTPTVEAGTPVTYVLENRGTTTLEYGSPWKVERWDGEAWQTVPHEDLIETPHETAWTGWTAQLNRLQPGSREESTLPPIDTPGWHRVVKSFTPSGTDDEFEVEGRFHVVASATPSEASTGRFPAAAQRLCGEVAALWGGEVAAAFDVTVQNVRDYMSDPHGAGDDPTAPRPGAYRYPEGWDDKRPADAAAVCYLDGPIPKAPPPGDDGTALPPFDRRLVIAADQAEPFMVSAGYQDTMPLEPLPKSRR